VSPKKKSFGNREGCAEIPEKQSCVDVKTLDVTRECLIRKEHLKLPNYSLVNIKMCSIPSRSISTFPRLKCCLVYENETWIPVIIIMWHRPVRLRVGTELFSSPQRHPPLQYVSATRSSEIIRSGAGHSSLWHELSSVARKLGSWVRIPHKAWMFDVCIFCVYVVLCLGRGLATGWSLVQGVLPSVKWSWNWKAETRAQGSCVASRKKNSEW
jgi:hypothetical protein